MAYGGFGHLHGGGDPGGRPAVADTKQVIDDGEVRRVHTIGKNLRQHRGRKLVDDPDLVEKGEDRSIARLRFGFVFVHTCLIFASIGQRGLASIAGP